MLAAMMMEGATLISRPALEFHYQLVRIWQQRPEALLEGGLGTLPLVPLCDTDQQALPPLIHRNLERLELLAEQVLEATSWEELIKPKS
jgi:hypothetical protein